MIRVLLTHSPIAFDRYFGPSALAALSQFAQVERQHGDSPLDAAALIQRAQGCQVILSDRATPAPARVFAELPGLCAFVRCAVDIRTIDVAAASDNGVLVTRASAGFVSAVAEWTLGAMINLARGICRSAETYHRGVIPVAHTGIQLHGSSIGIVGLGAIGQSLGRSASALGLKVLAHDPCVGEADAQTELVGFDELLARADFVVCLAPANEQTENMFDAQAFSSMKDTAYFINPSRGNLVDEAALADALSQGRLAGAALDVGRATDQTPSLALAAMPSVIATPHIGGLTRQAVEHQAFETVRQIASLNAGEIPEGAVNAEFASRLPIG